MIAWGVFFDATASDARLSVNVAAFAHFHRSAKDGYADFGMHQDKARVNLFGHLPYSITNLAETPGKATEDLVGDHQGGTRASWRTPGLWPMSLEP